MIILLYVMDSLRADFLSCYGYARDTSPNIDKLAADGVLFRNAFAHSTWTRLSGASLLSSTYPSVHGVNTMKDSMPDTIPILPAALKENGFKTIGISSMGNISPAFGFARGFDDFVELYKQRTLIEKRVKSEVSNASLQTALGLDADFIPLATSEDANDCLFPLLWENRHRNLFILVWSIDTHDPYFHRDPNLAKFCEPSGEAITGSVVTKMLRQDELDRLRALYEDMIYFNDYHLGLLMRKLRDWGLFNQSLFVLTSDHGEAFCEHGVNSHAGLPFDEQIKVPLIIKFPESAYSGRRIDTLVQHIDIGNTILEYAGLGEALLQGKSMLPLLSDETGDETFINQFSFSEGQYPYGTSPRFVALRTKEYKYIGCPDLHRGKSPLRRFLSKILSRSKHGHTLEKPLLFAIAKDPKELKNISGDKKRKKHFGTLVDEILEGNRKISENYMGKEERSVKIDEATAKQLKALGYID